jgi:hypothetical protein
MKPLAPGEDQRGLRGEGVSPPMLSLAPHDISKWPWWPNARATPVRRRQALRGGGAEEQPVREHIYRGSICWWGEGRGGWFEGWATTGSGRLTGCRSQLGGGTCRRCGQRLRRRVRGGRLTSGRARGPGWGGGGDWNHVNRLKPSKYVFEFKKSGKSAFV